MKIKDCTLSKLLQVDSCRQSTFYPCIHSNSIVYFPDSLDYFRILSNYINFKQNNQLTPPKSKHYHLILQQLSIYVLTILSQMAFFHRKISHILFDITFYNILLSKIFHGIRILLKQPSIPHQRDRTLELLGRPPLPRPSPSPQTQEHQETKEQLKKKESENHTQHMYNSQKRALQLRHPSVSKVVVLQVKITVVDRRIGSVVPRRVCEGGLRAHSGKGRDSRQGLLILVQWEVKYLRNGQQLQLRPLRQQPILLYINLILNIILYNPFHYYKINIFKYSPISQTKIIPFLLNNESPFLLYFSSSQLHLYLFMKKTKEQIQKISAHVQFQTVSPATKLLEERRKMYEVHEAFQVQKQQFKKHEQNFKAKEEDIRKRDLQIQIHLINFCQYLQENDSKRKKAQQRFKQDLQVFNKKQWQIKQLEQQIEKAYQKQKKFDNKVSSLRKYEQYLQKVRQTYSDQYPEMPDILSRYQTLKKFNQKLLKDRDQTQTEKQNLKKQSATFQKEMNQTILQLNNQIKDYSKKLQNKVNQKQQLQSQLQRNRDLYEKKNLDLAKMLIAIDNLYSKCGQSVIKIKHNHEQFAGQIDPKSKKSKKGDDKNKGKKVEGSKEQNKHDEEDNDIQFKCKLATQKLKSIFAYTKDFKSILEQYKKQVPGSLHLKKF